MIAPMKEHLLHTTQTGSGSRRERAVIDFLGQVLAQGPVAVVELEQRARNLRLLGVPQRITAAKGFKRGKTLLGAQSNRSGFGRGGEWLWGLPGPPQHA